AEARTALAVAEHDIASLTEALGSDARRRQTAVDALEAVAGTEPLGVAHPELTGLEPDSWSVDRAGRTARHLLADVVSDDLAWQRTQRGIHGHLQTLVDTLLPHGYEPSATLVDQVLVVTVPFQGRTCSMTQLRAGERWVTQVNPALAPALARTGRAVHEEQVLPDLLTDLAHPAPEGP
ncbi:MAG: hypothetical protein ACRDZ4_17015, partial [Egibacteraceae bacterium]